MLCFRTICRREKLSEYGIMEAGNAFASVILVQYSLETHSFCIRTFKIANGIHIYISINICL